MRYYSRKFVKESQTMGQVKNSVDSHQSSAQGERRGDRLSLWSPGSDWQTFVVAASDHNKCKNSFDHSSHFTGVTQCDHPPPPPWSVRSLRCPAEQDKRHREAGFTTPALDTRERGRGRRETWPHKNSVYANPSTPAFNYLGELMNSNGTIYAATTKLETFER